MGVQEKVSMTETREKRIARVLATAELLKAYAHFPQSLGSVEKRVDDLLDYLTEEHARACEEDEELP